MEFHMLLFFFFFKYSHDLSTDLSKTLLFKASFLFKTSFLFQNLFPFLCKATFFMSLYYSRLRVLRAFKFFFLFLHFVQISNMDDNTNYQEDYEEDLLSDIFPLQEQTSGRKKSHVWDHYETHGIKKHGHVGCICRACGWKRAVGKVCEMVDHLALSCTKVSIETRQIFLQEVRDRNTHPPPKKTKKNNGKF